MNGRVMVVGGSLDFHGAPVFSGLGALYSGADLVYLWVPESNFDVTRCKYPDLIVRSFPGSFLDMKAVSSVVDFAKQCDAILIGPGLGKREETTRSIFQILQNLTIPTVLDAEAIQVFHHITTIPLPQKIVITPHQSEFEKLTGKDIKISASVDSKVAILRAIARDLHLNILLKGPDDFIASEEGTIVMNSTGNAGMTVGGTGDVLSGVVASLIAQGAQPFEACQAAAYLVGKTGDALMKNKGYCFSASDVALELPYIIQETVK